ncbi:Dyp-type peroxidase [Nocardioides ultimimeridianus]
MKTEPQTQAVLAPLSDAAIFLTLTVDPGGETTVRELLGELSGLRRSVGFRVPEATLSCVAGIGSDLWDRMLEAPRPIHLHPFAAVEGPKHQAPSTPGDLLLHLRASRIDMCFELAQLVVQRLDGAARVVDEVHGFRSWDERDLLGFVDGTENPEGSAASAAVLIGDEDPAYAGGSYVITQKYLHDMAAWQALTVEQQEAAIGRTKLNDVELADDVKAADAHTRLTVIEEDGVQRQILRANMPFGRVGAAEFGTYFIGYAADPGVTEEMLRRMFVGEPAGTTDRILDFSTAVTGSLYFVPTTDFLDGLGE